MYSGIDSKIDSMIDSKIDRKIDSKKLYVIVALKGITQQPNWNQINIRILEKYIHIISIKTLYGNFPHDLYRTYMLYKKRFCNRETNSSVFCAIKLMSFLTHPSLLWNSNT